MVDVPMKSMVHRTMFDTISGWQVVDVQISFGLEITVWKFGCSDYVIVFGSIFCSVICDLRLCGRRIVSVKEKASDRDDWMD